MNVPPFEVSVIWEDEHPIVSLKGELDYGTAHLLEDSLGDLMQKDVQHLTLDMSEVTFIDSEGVKVLLRAYKSLQTHGGTMDIRGYSRFVANVFEILGIQEYIQVTGHL